MRKVDNICFPRSGHRLLQRLLKKYFGRELKTGTIYVNTGFAHNPSCNYQKNHDFGLDTPILSDIYYLVQIRYPLESIISYYCLKVNGGRLLFQKKSWEQFALSKIPYWINFYKKWITNVSNCHKLIVNYKDLVDKPEEEISAAVEFIGQRKANIEKIKEIVNDSEIKQKNFMRGF